MNFFKSTGRPSQRTGPRVWPTGRSSSHPLSHRPCHLQAPAVRSRCRLAPKAHPGTWVRLVAARAWDGRSERTANWSPVVMPITPSPPAGRPSHRSAPSMANWSPLSGSPGRLAYTLSQPQVLRPAGPVTNWSLRTLTATPSRPRPTGSPPPPRPAVPDAEIGQVHRPVVSRANWSSVWTGDPL